MSDERDLEITEDIYDALEAGEPERALALARRGLTLQPDDDPVLQFLAGRALLELDQPAEALTAFARAVELDPDDGEFRAFGAWAAFRACRFDEAREQVAAALADERLPEAHYVHGLLLEREGRTADSDQAFARAAKLGPEWFPLPVRVGSEEFQSRLDEARSALPADFRRHLDAVQITVDDLPSDEVLHDTTPPFDPEQLLGLFTGIPLPERTSFDAGGELPPRILLFRRNLERHAQDSTDLAEQIRITLFHELGHFLGLNEEELEQLGYG